MINRHLINIINSRGFTLIELSLSIVIIGLILFSILKGGTILFNTKEHKLIEGMDSLFSGVKLFEMRHPGNRIYNIYAQNPYSSGIKNLAAERLIPPVNSMIDQKTGGIIAAGGVGYLRIYLTQSGLIQTYIQALGISKDTAQYIDSRKDDGFPNTGLCTARKQPALWNENWTPTSNTKYSDFTNDDLVDITCLYD